ncbi:PPE family protein [[Mycobacterium] nativiensis]|uniref:PPE family protein n=1 Tax=[Mycobacterium] nativiensis TaxID=2855503 RepID=A0ABU5XTD9_9MYCO|nr:PPE family protein [Mycolicibacter sp. MYC340]MEB3031245.1 PPE family protein [Mycolicibacter sp. MYC340]
MDFGALPPEVNSGRMYSGAGPGPLLSAASAWSELAAELQSAAAGYGTVVADLSGDWHGPSAAAMSVAAAPYVEWMRGLAGQAEQAGVQASAAAAAYEAAFAATVPPPVIAANRSLLMTLIATNILGLNGPAIAATEAQYAQMWAQDAAAMYGYAGAASAATKLTPFAEPPPTTSEAGAADQQAAVAQAATTSGGSVGQQISQALTTLPNTLQTLSANPAAASSTLPGGLGTDLANWNTIMSTLTGPYEPLLGASSMVGGPFLSFGQSWSMWLNSLGAGSYLAGPKAISGALTPLAPMASPNVAGLAGAPVTGSLGRAALVGKLSVPPAWGATALPIQPVSLSLPAGAAAPAVAFAGEDALFSEMALSSLAGRAMGATTGRAVGATITRATGCGVSAEVLGEADPAAATIVVIPALDED